MGYVDILRYLVCVSLISMDYTELDLWNAEICLWITGVLENCFGSL